MTTMCPIPAAVAPPPMMPRSTTATRRPRRASWSEQTAPTMPAPTITTSYADSLILHGSSANPHAERVALIEHQFGFRIHKRRSLNARVNFALAHFYASFEYAADNALLPPGLTFLNLAVGIETRKLGAGAGSARRAVVCIAWA